MGNLEINQQEDLLKKEDKDQEIRDTKEVSPEIVDTIQGIDEAIQDRLDIDVELGEFAKEIMTKGYSFSKERVKIDFEPLKIGNQELNDEFDEKAYAEANSSFAVRNMLAYIRHLFKRGSIYALHSKEGKLLDKRRITQLAQNSKNEYGETPEMGVTTEEEKKELAKLSGLSEEDLGKVNFTKKYGLVDGKIMKTIIRNKTEQEKCEQAADILKNNLNNIENNEGQRLIDAKESLLQHRKHIQDAQKILENQPHITDEYKKEFLQGLQEKEEEYQEIINEQKEQLKFRLEKYTEPLLERQTETQEMIESLDKIKSDIKEKKKQYEKDVRSLEKDIRQAKKFKLLDNKQDDLVQELSRVRKQMVVNLEAFSQRLEMVEARLGVLKLNAKELGIILKQVDNIGKTRAELQTEKKKDRTDKKEDEADEIENEDVDNPELVRELNKEQESLARDLKNTSDIPETNEPKDTKKKVEKKTNELSAKEWLDIFLSQAKNYQQRRAIKVAFKQGGSLSPREASQRFGSLSDSSEDKAIARLINNGLRVARGEELVEKENIIDTTPEEDASEAVDDKSTRGEDKIETTPKQDKIAEKDEKPNSVIKKRKKTPDSTAKKVQDSDSKPAEKQEDIKAPEKEKETKPQTPIEWVDFFTQNTSPRKKNAFNKAFKKKFKNLNDVVSREAAFKAVNQVLVDIFGKQKAKDKIEALEEKFFNLEDK